jgi:hypothetical protein
MNRCNIPVAVKEPPIKPSLCHQCHHRAITQVNEKEKTVFNNQTVTPHPKKKKEPTTKLSLWPPEKEEKKDPTTKLTRHRAEEKETINNQPVAIAATTRETTTNQRKRVNQIIHTMLPQTHSHTQRTNNQTIRAFTTHQTVSEGQKTRSGENREKM